MEFMPAPLSRADSDRRVDRIAAHCREHAFGQYALQLGAERRFIGSIGLCVPVVHAPFTP
jgi:hypothetical protein